MKKFILKNKVYFFISFSFFPLFLCFFLFYNRIIFKSSIKNEMIDFGSEYIPESINACYGNIFKCHSIDVSLYNSVDTSKLGNYEVVYSAVYGKHKKSVTKKVSVVDSVEPSINVSSYELSVCPNSDKYDVDYTAFDNYDGIITDKVSIDVSEDKLILSVIDSSGNSASKVINLKREDISLPSISLNDGETLYNPVGTGFTDPGYTASDNCDGDITDKVSVSGAVLS